MSILNRDEYFEAVHQMVGDDTSEEAITFLENMTDTYNDMESRSSGDSAEWERKLNALDESWKKRYRHRFFSGGGGTPNEDEPTKPTADDITVDDLFK